eukprot:g7927.t1
MSSSGPLVPVVPEAPSTSPAPAGQVMSRDAEDDDQALGVRGFRTDPVQRRMFQVWAPAAAEEESGEELPVVLFQSGYHSNSSDHEPVLRRIAAAGFVTIAVDRENDKACGACGVVGFLNGCSCAAQPTDGSNLQAALEWAKHTKSAGTHAALTRANLAKVAVMGFSMGAQEAVHAAARFPDEVGAVVIFSGSLMAPAATAYGFNPCCAKCGAGGTCFSDTPLSICCGMAHAMRGWAVPSLHVTSDGDLVRSAAYRAAAIAGAKGGGEAHLVTLKGSALDLSIPRTKAGTAWGLFTCLDCYGCPLKGMHHHFAMGHERGPAHEPVTGFLRQVFYGEEGALKASDSMVGGKLNTKAPVSCCSPFFAFHSCFAC